jgi:AAA15 family ATPase/GTPase
MNNDSDSCVYIHGLGISSYRSFPEDIQQIYPFKKINLFIGRNNSGKSNILNFLYKHYLSIFRGEDMNFDKVDYHNFKLFQKKEIQINFYLCTPNKGWKDELIQNYKSRTSEKISTTRASRSNSMNHNSGFDNGNETARIADRNRAESKSQDNREKVQILQKILEYLELTLLNQNSYYWIINQKYSIGSYFKFKDLEINNLEKKFFTSWN